MELNQVYSHFKVVGKHFIEEQQSMVYELIHEKSGAKLFAVDNKDENKTFSIGFRTIPEDDTGVFHILEHSTLVASKNYPVKGTFVELMKSSMKNYLNAFTYADKTMYVFATINEKDYINLMDAYLDAVFQPLFYEDKSIFEQEGWHYEFDEKSQKPYINGVVYNEMKGVYSSMNAILSSEVSRALFANHPYGCISGGDPKFIPSLTYEKFLATHRNVYTADNCCIVLYGNMDFEEKLELIDQRHLSRLTSTGNRQDIPSMESPKEKIHTSLYHVEQPTGRDVQAAAAFVLGTVDDRKRIIASFILTNALMKKNDSPLKKALIDSGLGANVFAGIMDAILYPYITFSLYDTTKEDAKHFPDLLRQEVKKILERGLDKDLLLAEINACEFMLNEKGSSMPDGIEFGIDVVSAWIHKKDYTLFLEYNTYFQQFREELESDYFEKLLNEIILENPSHVEVTLLADDQQEMKQPFVQKKEMQVLNPLTLKDLKKEEETVDTEYAQFNQVKFLYHPIHNNEISYINWYFDLGGMENEDLPYVQLMSALLGGLDTTRQNAQKLNILATTWLGGWSTYLDAFIDAGDSCKVYPKFVFSSSVLNFNIEQAVNIPEEILLHTVFGQKEEILHKLQQIKLGMERGFISGGNYYASLRSSAYYSVEGMFSERINGYSYYQFICQLINDYETQYSALERKLSQLQKMIFTKNMLTVSYAGKKESYQNYCSCYMQSEIAKTKRTNSEIAYQDTLNQRMKQREAFVIQSNVAYNVMGGQSVYTGTGRVTAHVLNYNYLWQNIRVKGGAYGAGMQLGMSGRVTLYSYRDPNIVETYGVYKTIPEYLRQLQMNEKDMMQNIVGTMAGVDRVFKPLDRLKYLDRQYFSGETADMRRTMREEICNINLDDIRNNSEMIQDVLQNRYYCTFGGKDMITRSASFFEQIHTV